MTRLLTFWLSVAVAGTTGIALAFSPLLGVHGVESALALGIIIPPWVAATAANYQRHHGELRGIDVALRAIGGALVVLMVPVGLLGLNAIRVRQCAPLEGLAFMWLGPAFGCALAAMIGVWVAALMRGSKASPWAAAAIPLGALLWGLSAFYTTPTVHVFGIFAGYFPGAIYDDLVPIPSRYLTYRAVTLIAIVALTLLFDAVWDRTSELLTWRRAFRHRLGTLLAGGTMLAIVVCAYGIGDHLGHWISDTRLAEVLGKREDGKRCVVFMPRETPPTDAQRLVEDCDFQVARTRALIGLESDEQVTAYFFRNRDEKRKLIGVGRTLIAKPWRNEVYLQASGWPHPVLGHEVAHAVLRDAARGPFMVSGSLGGLIPNPGIVEGAAVALAWDVRDDLTPDQWSRILLDRNELPTAESILSLEFSALPARRAYMTAGSLVRFLIASRGPDAFLRAYREGRVEDLESLESGWHAYLDDIEVTDHERGVAEVALARPSIFGAVCPHRLAKLRADLAADAAARDDVRTIETCQSILRIDDTDAQAHAALVGALARTGRENEAREELDALMAAMNAPKPIVAAALEQYADASWTAGRTGDAATLYDQLLEVPQTDGPARQGEVKRLGLASDPPQQALIYEMLIEAPSGPIAVHVARELSKTRRDGLGPYLEARQVMSQGRYTLAVPLLEEAEARGLPTERLARELSRMQGVAYFAVGRFDDSKAAWSRRAAVSPAAAVEAARWIERIEYAQVGTVSPTLPGPSSAPRADP
ncbi:MAG: hypothetical protein WBG86_20965 [Polyangiales bacterium]